MTIAANAKAALIIAHPGHELCVYGWLIRSSPTVFVLTDGSGRSGVSRLDSTTRILAEAGAAAGSIYGRFTDQQVYKAILERDYSLFGQLIAELAHALINNDIDYVVGDASEGYNPIHDACRLMINASVELAQDISGRKITNREFQLFAPHDRQSDTVRANAIWLTLDDKLLQRKVMLAQAYREIQLDVDAMLERKSVKTFDRFPKLSALFKDTVAVRMGPEAYRTECLRLVYGQPAEITDIPFYEEYGKLLVSEGTYERAISYADHMAPLVQAIRSFVLA